MGTFLSRVRSFLKDYELGEESPAEAWPFLHVPCGQSAAPIDPDFPTASLGVLNGVRKQAAGVRVEFAIAVKHAKGKASVGAGGLGFFAVGHGCNLRLLKGI